MDLPQETMVWYVVPAVRRAIVLDLKEMGLKQKEIAPILGVTESAVSQYVKDKRAGSGSKITSIEPLKSKILESSKKIFTDKKQQTMVKEMNKICAFVRDEKIICKFHHINHPDKKCNMCYE